GTQIVIVNIPRPAPIETRYLSDQAIRQREKLIQRYQRSVKLDYWSFPRPLPFSYYWDLRHMNGKGRKRFSNWLFEHIQEQYDQSPIISQ
ncbi:MAG: SGNH/GDSL hydrolase family protein, partial [Lewinella sp.]|nr:SGNH/GDSL hydrolase family protein [Lewinella sp.]